jgi:hypothetical protein
MYKKKEKALALESVGRPVTNATGASFQEEIQNDNR